MSPERTSRSQRGALSDARPGRPAMSPVKLYCIRTPWLPVTIIAAYAEPCLVLALMMIPALAHGTRPGVMGGPCEPGPGARTGTCEFPDACSPVSEVTRAVIVPLPVTGLRTK